MKILVTGANGFIGRCLVDRLLDEGNDVSALIRTDNHRINPSARIVKGDILDLASIEGSVKGCDRVFHLAAMVSFDPLKRNDLIKVNCQGTRNVLELSKKLDVESTVVVSSACTIGLSYSKAVSLDENSPLDERLAQRNPYMFSKLETEKIAKEYSKDQKVIVVNPTTVYGHGDYTLNSGTLISKIYHSRIVPVPPGGGNVVDIDDVVEGIIAAGKNGKSGQRYILGGANLTFSEIFKTIAAAVNSKAVLVKTPAFTKLPLSIAAGIFGKLTNNRLITSQIIGDMFAYKYYSSKLAEKELGWKPKYTFKESIEKAWAFYKKENLI